MTRAKGYASRRRRRAVIAAVAAVAWALAAVAVVLVVPLGTSVSVEAVEDVEGVEGVEGVEAVPGRSTRSSYTLLEEEGPGLLVVLAIPVVLALAGAIGAATDRAWLATCTASLLVFAVLLGAASIGLFLVPRGHRRAARRRVDSRLRPRQDDRTGYFKPRPGSPPTACVVHRERHQPGGISTLGQGRSRPLPVHSTASFYSSRSFNPRPGSAAASITQRLSMRCFNPRPGSPPAAAGGSAEAQGQGDGVSTLGQGRSRPLL